MSRGKTFSNLEHAAVGSRLPRGAQVCAGGERVHLSHSAVSHQIKLLEEELGQPLFRRVGRAVVLTDAGNDFARTVRDILHRLEDGVARLAPYQNPAASSLHHHGFPRRGFVMSRMAQCPRATSDVDLWLDTSERKVDFKTMNSIFSSRRPMASPPTAPLTPID